MKSLPALFVAISVLTSCSDGVVDWDKVGNTVNDYYSSLPPPPLDTTISISSVATSPNSTSVDFKVYYSIPISYQPPIDTNIVRRGVCYAPENTSFLTCSADTGQTTGSFSTYNKRFTAHIEGLIPGTKYNLWPYAIMSDQDSVVGFTTFTTLFVTTTIPDSITDSTAVCGGKDIYAGTNRIIRKGVMWLVCNGTDMCSPTLDVYGVQYTNDGAGSGEYLSKISGLVKGWRYMVRSYVVTSDEVIHYGHVEYFETPN